VNNRINFCTVSRSGGTYTARQQEDFLVSDDPWYRPVDIKLGPDGALYVADFYNRIIGHYEVPLDHPGRDRTSGRIWRIVYTGANSTSGHREFDLSHSTSAQLIQELASPNITRRRLAMDQLV